MKEEWKFRRKNNKLGTEKNSNEHNKEIEKTQINKIELQYYLNKIILFLLFFLLLIEKEAQK